MKYNVTLVDPGNYKYAYLITDVCRIIAHGLRSLGFTCDLTTNFVDAGAINVILGTHLLSPGSVDSIVQSGVNYICHQSELLAPGIGPQKIVSAFLGDQFEARCRKLYEHASFIWEPYEENGQLLTLFNIPAERIKPFRQGFHPDLMDIKHRPWAEKDIDVLFVGSPTSRRQQILTELSRYVKVHSVLDAPAAFRNDLIARAKINLNLRAHDNSKRLEAGRVTYLFNNRCVVVSEIAESHAHLHPLMVNAPYDGLVDTCRQILAQGPEKLDEIAETSFAQYQRMPMTDVLRNMLGLPAGAASPEPAAV